jgi:hypothetical protein
LALIATGLVKSMYDDRGDEKGNPSQGTPLDSGLVEALLSVSGGELTLGYGERRIKTNRKERNHAGGTNHRKTA